MRSTSDENQAWWAKEVTYANVVTLNEGFCVSWRIETCELRSKLVSNLVDSTPSLRHSSIIDTLS